MKKVVIVLLAISAAVLLFFAENIKGYYRFKHFCDTEGGLTVYENVERGVGWITEEKWKAETLGNIEEIDFIRFLGDRRNKDKYFDMKTVSGSGVSREDLRLTDANFEKKVHYRYELITEAIESELRLSKQSRRVFEVEGGQNLAEFNSFNYALYNRKNTILGAPSNVYCRRYNREEFSKIFK